MCVLTRFSTATISQSCVNGPRRFDVGRTWLFCRFFSYCPFRVCAVHSGRVSENKRIVFLSNSELTAIEYNFVFVKKLAKSTQSKSHFLEAALLPRTNLFILLFENTKTRFSISVPLQVVHKIMRWRSGSGFFPRFRFRLSARGGRATTVRESFATTPYHIQA